jgi:hypothetical protein
VVTLGVVLVAGCTPGPPTDSPSQQSATSQPAPTATPDASVAGAGTAQPEATPTVPPRPTPAAATPAPTSGPPTAHASPTPPTKALLEQVDLVLAGLRSGTLEATSDYADGTHTSVSMQFRFGDQRGPARSLPALLSRATYASPDGDRTVERLMWGDQTWQRESGGTWREEHAPQEGVFGSVRPFLPQLAEARDAELVTSGAEPELHWVDRPRNADMVLRVDPRGVPKLLRRTAREGGPVLEVTYTGWNTPVDIPVPPLSP